MELCELLDVAEELCELLDVAEELCEQLTVLVDEPLTDALVVADPLIVLVGDGDRLGVEDTLAVELIL